LLTGEIIYSQENETSVKNALAVGTYSLEVERIESKHVKAKPDKICLNIDSKLAEKIAASYVYGEVLNRAIEPCWWR